MNQSSIKRPALGQGLSALLGPDTSTNAPHAWGQGHDDVIDQQGPQQQKMINIRHIISGTYQPRKHFDEQEIEGLAQSIRENGIIQPIVVRPTQAGKYEIIAGERRWRAADRAGLREVPVVVRDKITDQQALEIGLLENVQRLDLNSIEEAEGYQRLIQEFGYTQESIANTLGKSRPHITNTLRLLNLTPKVLNLLKQKAITPGHARVLLSTSATEADRLVDVIVAKGLNVRQTERLVKNALQEQNPDSVVRKTRGLATSHEGNGAYKSDMLVELEQVVEKLFSAPCQIVERNTGVQLTLTFQDYDHFDQFLNKVAP